MHTTIKPVALARYPIRDYSRRGDVVLDMFDGSDSTLIAADFVARRAHLVKYDVRHCDTM